jgi:uncharacterized membrane protein YdjX (TVP38/TMEM64 family)
MQDTLIQWASYWDGSLAWAAVTALFLISGLVIIPRPAICIVAGLTFGLAAFPLALIASTAGSLIAFVLARYFFRARFLRMLERHPKAKVLVEAVEAEGWRLLFLLRLASPIPGPISNYAFGLSSIRMLPYVLATAIGIAPQVVAFVYLGALGKEALDDPAVSSIRLMFGIAGFAVLLLVIAMVTRRVRQSIRTRLAGAAEKHETPSIRSL